MTLDPPQAQALIISQVGDQATPEQPSGIVAANIAALWALHDEQPTAKLQFLYAKREAISLLMGSVRQQVTVAGNDRQIALTDKLKNLKTMWDATDRELSQAEALRARQLQQAAASRAPLRGTIRTTAPTTPPDGHPDANAARFRGDVYDHGFHPC